MTSSVSTRPLTGCTGASVVEVRCPYCHSRMMDSLKGNVKPYKSSEYDKDDEIVCVRKCECKNFVTISFNK